MRIEYNIFIWLFITVFCLLYLALLSHLGIYFLQHTPKAMDFLAFYTGGQVLSLAPTNLYNLHAQLTLQQQIEPIIKSNGIFLPFLNPPFVALVFKMFILGGFINGYVALLGINIVLLTFICLVFLQQMKKIKWYYKAAFVVIISTFIPILITMLVGQLSIFLCAIFLFSWVFLKREQEFQSGLILSLILIKPHFFLLPFAAILIQRRKKQIAGIISGTAMLVIISFLCVGWAGINSYITLIMSFYNSGVGYNINLTAQQSTQALLLMLFHTNSLDQIRTVWILTNVCIIIPTLLIWSKKFNYSSPQISIQFALLIIATLLTSPHTHFYDVSLLLVVAALLLVQINAFKRKQKILFIIFIILCYCVPMVGYGIFALAQDSTKGIWIIPTVVFLILFWLILLREACIYRRGNTLE